MVAIHLDDEIIAVIPDGDEPLDRRARELMVLELYRRGAISSGKAGKLLGMSRIDFIKYSGELGIPYIDMTDEEWESEMRTLGLR